MAPHAAQLLGVLCDEQFGFIQGQGPFVMRQVVNVCQRESHGLQGDDGRHARTPALARGITRQRKRGLRKSHPLCQQACPRNRFRVQRSH
jgi:hypothetical protein